MLKMTDNIVQDSDEPPSMITSPDANGDVSDSVITHEPSFFSKVKALFTGQKPDPSLREAIEDYLDGDEHDNNSSSILSHEKALISNVLELRDLCASDVMIPRADIVAIDLDTNQTELLKLLSERQYSRLPVYQGTLDEVIGSIHIKDIMATLARNEKINITELVRDVPIISPSMHVLDLLLEMRTTKKHMVMVVDEFGGIDGLITIGDLVEDIVGEIEDEHHQDTQPEMTTQTDGTIIADGRVDIDDFEDQFGEILSEEERDEIDTLGGLVFFMAGRVPARGEVLTHDTGMKFEILEADPRRVSRICIRNVPNKDAA